MAVHEELTLTVDPTAVSGKLVLTCWAQLAALIPDGAPVWVSGAAA